MEKDEKNIVEPVVDTVDNNEPVVEPTQDENPKENVTVDDNTEVDPEQTTDKPVDVPEVETPVEPLVGDPVVDAPVEDPTLATTDEVIPVPVDVPGTEPVVDIDNPPMDPVIPEDPAALAPAEPVDAPVENPEPGDAGCPGGVPNCDGACDVEPTTPCESPVTVANYFGTLQDCVTIAWRFHLKTKVYRYHKVLNDFYDSALHIVDDIIEQYQGICGVVEDTFTNCIVGDGKTEGEYFTELKAFVENNKCVLGDHSELNSVVDEFLSLIDSTLYQLTSFTENAVKSFEEFVYEDYQVDESCKYFDDSDDESNEEE